MRARHFAILAACLLGVVADTTTKTTGTIQDLDHVVLFMQENRAFDHYFGSMAGVRGFKDPNVQVNPDGKSVYYQKLAPDQSPAATYLLPWYINYLGGGYTMGTQCMLAGSNGWQANHAALNSGLNNHWAINNTVYSWGHYKRADVPVQFAIADSWTTGDMYSEGVIGSTNPNRVTWVSGSINVPGGPQAPDQGGPYTDNYETPGCESEVGGSPKVNCYPLKWKTFPEYMQDAGVDWQVYQESLSLNGNFDDNDLAYFQAFQQANASSPLAQRGLSFLGFDTFVQQAANGTLPMVSYIIGPAQLSEHPPYSPQDGGWFQRYIVDAITSSPKYSRTALIISYDETGGWGDHVTPITSPPGTAGEWMTDPYDTSLGSVPAGPGYRLPFYIVSPWTAGGNVFTEHADHNSQLMFLEKWLAAKGKSVQTTQINSWRRQHMSDLTHMFDFAHPNYTVPNLPNVPSPHTGSNGLYDGSMHCEETYPGLQQPVPPYGTQTEANSLITETGFKRVRGYLTEGRYLVFENGNMALTSPVGPKTTSSSSSVVWLPTAAAASSSNSTNSTATTASKNSLYASNAAPDHSTLNQRFVIHTTAAPPVSTFKISNSDSSAWIQPDLTLTSNNGTAAVFTIADLGNGQGHTLQTNGKYLTISRNTVTLGKTSTPFKVFSVTY